SQLAHAAIDPYQRVSVLVVEVLPVHATQKPYPQRARASDGVILAELLALPQHRHASAGQQRDRIGLPFEEAAAVGETAVGRRARRVAPTASGEPAMVVRVEVLQWRDRARTGAGG